MRSQIWFGAAVIATLGIAPAKGAAQGQLPVSLEARIDAGIPVGDSADGFETGVGFEGVGVLHLTPGFGLYAGYSTTRFGLDGVDSHVTLDGPEVGGRIMLGDGGALWTPFAQMGAIFLDDETGSRPGWARSIPWAGTSRSRRWRDSGV